MFWRLTSLIPLLVDLFIITLICLLKLLRSHESCCRHYLVVVVVFVIYLPIALFFRVILYIAKWVSMNLIIFVIILHSVLINFWLFCLVNCKWLNLNRIMVIFLILLFYRTYTDVFIDLTFPENFSTTDLALSHFVGLKSNAF